MIRGKHKLIGLLLGITVLIIAPIILNCVLQIPSPFNVPVVGDSRLWLSFWGAYSGGVLTALIGVISLCINQKNYQDQLMRQRQDLIDEYKMGQVKELEKELIKRVESLNFWSIGRILPRLNDGVVTREEILKEIQVLKERREKAEAHRISWDLMGFNELPSVPKDFNKNYTTLIILYQKDIDNVISVLNSCINNVNNALPDDKRKAIENASAQIRNNTLFMSEFLKPIRDWLIQLRGV